MTDYFRWLRPARPRTSAQAQREGESTIATKSAGLASMFALSSTAEADWSRADYASLAQAGFMKNPIVYRCIRLISETASAIPLLAYNGNKEQENHALLKLVERPNSAQGGRQFRETLIGHLLVSGNAYAELVTLNDQPRELHLLRPDRVRVLMDRNGWVCGYEYKTRNGKRRYQPDEQGRINILHLKQFHPLDDHYGFPRCGRRSWRWMFTTRQTAGIRGFWIILPGHPAR